LNTWRENAATDAAQLVKKILVLYLGHEVTHHNQYAVVDYFKVAPLPMFLMAGLIYPLAKGKECHEA